LQDQLKERLTGAAILVVVVVLAVPEMFHGRPAAPDGPAAPGAAAIPLRTYTMDLRSDPAAQPKRPDGGDTAAPVDTAPIVPLPQPDAAPAVQALDSASQQERPQGTTAGVIQRPEPAAPPQAEPAPEPKPVEKSPAKPMDKATTSGWAVQVGSFRSKELADRMVRQVRAKGFAVQLVGPDAKGLYRVRSALVPERAAAAALRERMIEKGLKPIINASP
jgi:cell division septation protein DedD